jgi:hypothetical protein
MYCLKVRWKAKPPQFHALWISSVTAPPIDRSALFFATVDGRRQPDSLAGAEVGPYRVRVQLPVAPNWQSESAKFPVSPPPLAHPPALIGWDTILFRYDDQKFSVFSRNSC